MLEHALAWALFHIVQNLGHLFAHVAALPPDSPSPCGVAIGCG
jgi:hypothetical protein